jgi:hypothetical protein
MSTGTTRAPSLPLAPIEYQQQYQDQLNRVLAQYFNQLDNPGASAGSATGVGTPSVIAALNFSQPTSTGGTEYSFPTQADLANLRVGDVYVDTSADNVLKMKL